MQCRCGYRFCFRCTSHDAQCSCDGPNHLFYDNVFDGPHDIFDASSVPAANLVSSHYLMELKERRRERLARKREALRSLHETRTKCEKESEDRKAKVIQRIIQNDISQAVEIYHREMKVCGGKAPSWSGELAMFLRFLDESEVQALFPGVSLAHEQETQREQDGF